VKTLDQRESGTGEQVEYACAQQGLWQTDWRAPQKKRDAGEKQLHFPLKVIY
jgi:hypothetical protein